MQVIKKKLPKYNAFQFNKEGDFPGVERGYIQTRNGHQAIFISDAMPRSIDCLFCYVIEINITRTPVFIGDWILVKIGSSKDKRKVVTNKEFLKKYAGYTDTEVLDSEHNK